MSKCGALCKELGKIKRLGEVNVMSEDDLNDKPIEIRTNLRILPVCVDLVVLLLMIVKSTQTEC